MKKEIEDELTNVSPFLAKLKNEMPKEEPFKTPKSYFDKLTDKIISNAKMMEADSVAKVVPTKIENKTHWLQRLLDWADNNIGILFQPRYALSMATITILVIIGWKLSVSPTEPIAEDGFASTEDIQQYIQDNIDDFDVELLQMHGDLAEVTTEDETNKLKILEDDSNSFDASDEEIKQYLKDNLDESDLKSLENEL